mmetsp:Transcript_39627/g.60677  ORF Transcript_39627/g.60677 Transcript_39627/m.60677 type:complete len:84 (-) Transcript_39627:2729-2980(-)
MDELNKQNQDLLNNDEVQVEQIESLKSQLLSSQEEVSHLKETQNRWFSEKDGLSAIIDDATEKLKDKSKEVETLLNQVNSLEK